MSEDRAEDVTVEVNERPCPPMPAPPLPIVDEDDATLLLLEVTSEMDADEEDISVGMSIVIDEVALPVADVDELPYLGPTSAPPEAVVVTVAVLVTVDVTNCVAVVVTVTG